MESMLAVKDLWNVTEDQAPGSQSTPEVMARYKAKNNKAISYILLNIDESHYHTVRKFETAKEVVRKRSKRNVS